MAAGDSNAVSGHSFGGNSGDPSVAFIRNGLNVLIVFAALAACWVPAARAQDAGIVVSPTYVLFDGRVRTQSVTLMNRGNTSQTYRISIVNRSMVPSGELVPIDHPAEGESFAGEFVRYSPHEIVLPPGKPQVVRFMVQTPADAPDGEYRSHILFQELPSDSVPDVALQDKGTGLTVNVRAIFGITIPIVIRRGTLTASAKLSDLRLVQLKDNTPGVDLKINRSGSRSLRGNLTVLVDGAPVGHLNSVGVFLSTPYREVVVPITAPVDLKGRRVDVQFQESEDTPSAVSAAETLTP